MDTSNPTNKQKINVRVSDGDWDRYLELRDVLAPEVTGVDVIRFSITYAYRDLDGKDIACGEDARGSTGNGRSLSVRIDPGDILRLEEIGERTGMTRSEAVRFCLRYTYSDIAFFRARMRDIIEDGFGDSVGH